MKIMWMTFAPIGRAAELLYGTPTQSGGWVDATLMSIMPYIEKKQIELQVVALCDKEITETDEKTGVSYRGLTVQRNRGKRGKKEDKARFKKIIEDFSPDVIQIWGTEFTFGLDVIEAAGDIPVCFYIQGVMASLVEHPLGDLPYTKLLFELGLSSLPKFRSLRKWHKINERHLAYEAQMISRSAGLILDNEWTKAQYSRYTDKFYNVSLAANKTFSDREWKMDECEKHTLFTVAGGICPQKGVHDAVLAVACLKSKYPDVKLYIPGAISSRKPQFLYDTLFIRHIRKIISKYGLEENVCFTGRLSAKEMADRMCKSNAFIMPSCVETHSSSLREAMLVGVPCVSTSVGSVPEFLNHSKNGFLYRYGEVETLAYYIDRIFSDDTLAKNIGAHAKQTVTDAFPQDKIGEQVLSAYEEIINGGKGNG